MARFVGEYKETFEVAVPLQVAWSHFGDFEKIGLNHPNIERWEKLDDQTIRFVLVALDFPGVKFKGDYTCRYEFGRQDYLEWNTVQTDNMWSTGRARFFTVGEQKTRIEFEQRFEAEMAVNRLLAKLVSPLVARDVRTNVRKYLEKMRACL